MDAVETVAYYKSLALEKAGVEQLNALVELAFSLNTIGGSFRFGFNGVWSAAIDYPPPATDLQAALVAMSSIGANGAIVEGVLMGPYYIEIAGANAGQVIPQPLIDGTALDPVQAIVPTILRQGKVHNYQQACEDAWDNHEADAKTSYHRFLLTCLDIVELKLGHAADGVDTQTGQSNIVMLKQSQRFSQLKALAARLDAQIIRELRKSQGATRQTYGGTLTTMTPNGEDYGVLVRNPRTGRLE